MSTCEEYLSSKIDNTKNIVNILYKILSADPDPNGANCKWLIDSYLKKDFILDEDEETVKEKIIQFKELFGEKRPLPVKGYSELKVMIRQKLEKADKKAKYVPKTKVDFDNCLSFFKNVKNTLPEPYKSYDKEESDILFDKLQKSNPTNDNKICIWVVEELKRGYIKEDNLQEVKNNLEKYLKLGLPLPNFYPSFPMNSNYQLVKDANDKNVDLLSTSDLGILLIPRNEKASCNYGNQTSWCTAQKNKYNKFEYYSKQGNLFIWFDNKLKDKYQFHFETDQLMDRDDNRISNEIIKNFMKHPILKPIFDEGIPKLLIEALEEIDKKTSYNYNKKEAINDILNYTETFVNGRWKEVERNILDINDLLLYLNYAIIAKDRWVNFNNDSDELFEDEIEELNEEYANIEKKILKARNISIPIIYAQKVMHKRWKPLEKSILHDKNYDNIVNYGYRIFKNKIWNEANKILEEMGNPKDYFLRNSIQNALDGNWKQAKELLKTYNKNKREIERQPLYLYSNESDFSSEDDSEINIESDDEDEDQMERNEEIKIYFGKNDSDDEDDEADDEENDSEEYD
jgi:hypothetical protein